MYRGEGAERRQLMNRFAAVIVNYRAFVRRSIAFLGWNRSMSQIVDPLPIVVQAPRVFAGQIQLGRCHTVLAGVRTGRELAVVLPNRLRRVRQLSRRDHPPRRSDHRQRISKGATVIDRRAEPDGSLELDDVEVRTPAGTRLIDPLDVRLDPGESLGHHRRRRAAGKTTLLRSLAQLWPFTSGTLRRPQDDDTMFLSQLPYVPLGDLRAVVSYPGGEGRFSDDGDPFRPRHRVARSSRQPARRGRRLGEGALARRATADRVRACPVGQTEGGLPRRGDIGARRRSGVRAVPGAAQPAARLHRGQRQPSHHRSNSTTTGASSCSATAPGGSSGLASPRRVRSCAAAEERALAQLGAAGVALAVLGDVGRACPRGVQAGDDAAVLAQHLAVDRHRKPAHGEAGVHRDARATGRTPPTGLCPAAQRIPVACGSRDPRPWPRTRCSGRGWRPDCLRESRARLPSPRPSPSRR